MLKDSTPLEIYNYARGEFRHDLKIRNKAERAAHLLMGLELFSDLLGFDLLWEELFAIESATGMTLPLVGRDEP